MFSEQDHTFALCAYKESPYAEECLKSLLGQTVRSSILIATSTPNTMLEELAAKYEVPLYVSGNEPSIKGDWNHAVARAETPLVTIAHQDDIYCPAYTERMLAGVNAAEKPLIFFTNYGELRAEGRVDENTLLSTKRRLLAPIARTGASSDTKIKRRIISLGNAICCPSVTYNRSALPDPLFTSDMKSNLDWDAWERFSRLDGSFVYAKEILMYHRVHEESETSRLIHDNTRTGEDFEMLSRFWPKPMARLINLAYERGQKSNG